MPVVSISPVLGERLSEEGAEELVRLLSLVEESSSHQALALAEERFARRLAETEVRFERRLGEQLEALEGRLNRRIGALDGRVTALENRITEEVAKLESRPAKLDNRITGEVAKVRTELAAARADLITWMFLFWIGQLAVVATLLFYFR